MSTAARKARKRAGIQFEATPKMPSGPYVTRAVRQADRKAGKKAAAAVQALIAGVMADPAEFYRSAKAAL